jgi:hypothetical protein
MTGKIRSVFLLAFFGAFNVSAQQQITQSPQAASLAAGALRAVTSGTVISDVTLTGTATRTAGSEVETANVTLKALGSTQSRIELVEPNGTHTEVFNLSADASQSYWIGPDGTTHSIADHNTLAGAVWFFPGLSILSQSTNPNYTISYVGLEMRNSESVQHLRFILQSALASARSNQKLAQLSSTDVYLDAASNLPIALAFNTHPDNDAQTNIPVEVDFSDYRIVQGVQTPFRIQKFVNGMLYLDLTIQASTLNSGIGQSGFSAN